MQQAADLRHLGRPHRFSDKEVQRDAKMVSYKVVDKASKPYVSVDIAGETKTFSPEEVSAMILTKVRRSLASLLSGGKDHWPPLPC